MKNIKKFKVLTLIQMKGIKGSFKPGSDWACNCKQSYCEICFPPKTKSF